MTHSTKEIDNHVAARIRRRRISLGLGQQQFAEMIGISGHQMYKYECGLNRVSVSMLYKIADKLGVPVVYFYDGLIESAGCPHLPHSSLLMDTLQSFVAIENDKHRKAFAQLVRILAQE